MRTPLVLGCGGYECALTRVARVHEEAGSLRETGLAACITCAACAPKSSHAQSCPLTQFFSIHKRKTILFGKTRGKVKGKGFSTQVLRPSRAVRSGGTQADGHENLVRKGFQGRTRFFSVQAFPLENLVRRGCPLRRAFKGMCDQQFLAACTRWPSAGVRRGFNFAAARRCPPCIFAAARRCPPCTFAAARRCPPCTSWPSAGVVTTGCARRAPAGQGRVLPVQGFSLYRVFPRKPCT
jgi:hypothetical protein